MSKKLLIIGAVIVAVLAGLPLVGNMGVKKITEERISMLEANGIKVDQSDNGSSYMTTKEHYEFTLEDATAFKHYLSTLSQAQVPAYLSTMLDDVVMGADVEYSNLLISSDIMIDLYPVAFSQEAGERMKTEDSKLYEQMVVMLENREFMYHMEYDISGERFKGNIKDIDKTITFEDGRTAQIVFEKATFTGKGTLVEPKSVDLNVNKANLDFSLPDDTKMKLMMEDLSSQSVFSAKNSFDLTYKVKRLNFQFHDNTSTLEVSTTDLETTSISVTTDGKLKTSVDASVKAFSMHDQNNSVALVDFTFTMDADNIDEAAYEAFQKASEQSAAGSQYTMLAAVGVVSKGFKVDIEKLSVEKIAINGSKMMDGFNHTIKIDVKKDENLMQKLQVSPMALLQNIDIDAKLNFASEFYAYMKAQGNNLTMADSFAKIDGDDVLFDIILKDGKVSVNGKSL
jgi:hypothetical protein